MMVSAFDGRELIKPGGVALAHQIAAHRPTRICEDSGYPKRASSQGALMSFRTHINLLAITGCECGIEVICKSPGCLRSISKTSALLYLKPGRKRRLPTSTKALIVSRTPFVGHGNPPEHQCEKPVAFTARFRPLRVVDCGLYGLGEKATD